MRYTFVKQHDITDCAAACMAMICLHYKKETTITRLRDMMGTDIKGTNLIGLANCAEKLGFVSQAVKVDKEGFLSEYTLPAIANVVTKEGLSHFVVIFKITKKHVIYGDPGKDLLRVEIKEFIKNFTGALLLLKPDNRFAAGKIATAVCGVATVAFNVILYVTNPGMALAEYWATHDNNPDTTDTIEL